ncbi:MAG: gamma-glutamyl-gamma-aminobutyrate hydrolase family protein [Deltaproteobacteria bacterium]|nr:gamma-glutamyl-gamma-aminobutyrate hydrolase family protein [Deltaproteobacteria bacterium]
MHGLLIDIDRKLPDASRYQELQNGIIQAAALTQISGLSINVSLNYIHFTNFEDQRPTFPEYDFFILSPQGCPWSYYQGRDISHLNIVAETIREFVFHKQLSVLGICGGHQFLTMVFGGEIGLIDHNYAGIVTSAYPKNCVAERGPTVIRTLKEDPIFEGITVHPGKFGVIQNHVEEVKIVPPAFINLASSELSGSQLIRLPGKIVYGTAFHPERGWGDKKSFQEAPMQNGKIILANFLKMAYAVSNYTDLN